MKRLVVGVGNPLSGDDGFGPVVIDRLRQSGIGPGAGITVLDAGTDLLNHIETFAGYDQVILVDAVLDPDGKLGPPGRVELLKEEMFSAWSEPSQGVHQISPLLGVRLFRTLHSESTVQICLVGLIVDQLTHYPIYLTDETIAQAISEICEFCSGF